MSENKFNFGNLLNQNAKKYFSSEEQNTTGQKPSENFSDGSDPVVEEKKIYKNRTRNKSFNLRFTEEEFSEVDEKIKSSGLNRTDFILKSLRNKKVIVVDDLTEALVEIRKQGININQIAHSMNSYALSLEKYKLQVYDDNAEWEHFASELEGLRRENAKTLELLNIILEKVV